MTHKGGSTHHMFELKLRLSAMELKDAIRPLWRHWGSAPGHSYHDDGSHPQVMIVLHNKKMFATFACQHAFLPMYHNNQSYSIIIFSSQLMEFSFSQVLLPLLYHFKIWRPMASVNHNKADESHWIFVCFAHSMPLLQLCSGGCSRKCHPWKVWTTDTSDACPWSPENLTQSEQHQSQPAKTRTDNFTCGTCGHQDSRVHQL